MKLVICEKPSVGRAVADVLGAKDKKEGYLEGNGYIVSWCIGHLLQSAEPQEYDAKYKSWNHEDLPIIPTSWKYVPSKTTTKQLKILVDLLKKCTDVINACDSGREGELIYRLVYNHSGVNKPQKRLWISSLEEIAIKDGFNSLRESNDALYNAAKCRQHADWLVGMNLTRLFSINNNAKLTIGRVQTPTLAMIVDRYLKIKNFVKEPFYVVELSGQLPKGTLITEREKLFDRNEATRIAEKCLDQIATVTKVETVQKATRPQKLYDLTTLQREANRAFGHTAAKVLELAQSLYEKKLITYPRTDSRFLSEDMNIAPLIADMIKIVPYNIAQAVLTTEPKQVIGKVSDHHAIIPTHSLTESALNSLPKEEQELALLIATRLLSAVSGRFIYDETFIEVTCKDELFKTKGKVVVSGGWKAVEQALATHLKKNVKDDEPIPKVVENQQFTAVTNVRDCETTPPKHFTEDTLLSAMENAVDMPEDSERKGLGTPATRASIIENLIKTEYVKRQKKNLMPTDKGINLIAILPDSVKSPELTAEWEFALKGIEKSENDSSKFMSDIQDYIKEIITAHPKSDSAIGNRFKGEPVGKCPRCSLGVFENNKVFACEKCKFVLFKDNKFFKAKKKNLTKKVVETLLNKGEVHFDDLWSETKQKKYSATIKLKAGADGEWPQFSMEFANKKSD